MANSAPEMTLLEKFIVDVLRGIVESALRAGFTPATVIRLYVSAAEEAFETRPMSLASWQTAKARRKEAEIQKKIRERLRASLLMAAVGAAMSPKAVAALLETNVASVQKEKGKGRLLAFQHPFTGVDLFPVFQFYDSRIATWVPELIAIFGNSIPALQFLTLERKNLKGSSYLKRIQESLAPRSRAMAISKMLKAARESLP